MAQEQSTRAEPGIVERDRELAALRAALDASRAGQPSVVLFSGEPGMGKTHLLRSLTTATGAIILRGYALEADTPPYFPFRRALARHEREHTLASGHSAAVLVSAGVLAGDPGIGTATESHELAVLDALTELFTGLATDAPVVLVLDDMQWAAARTWEAVTYLARALDGSCVAFVLASRPEGIEPPGPGAAAAAELTRNGLLRLLPLRPLSPHGIATLVEQRTGNSPSPDLVSTLSARTAGNPFYLEELLRTLSEAGRLEPGPSGLALAQTGAALPLPETLKLAIWQRVSRLPGATRAVLHAAAVLGRACDTSLLCTMLQQPAEWVSGRLMPAARAGIILESSAGRWTFAHDTLRDAVYEQAADSRPELHSAAARALSAMPRAASDLETAAAVAHHLRQAGEREAAIPATIQASNLALAMHAPGEALQLALIAQELFASTDNPPSHLAAVDLSRTVAQAADAAGDFGRALSEWSTVLELVNDPAEQARTLVSLATTARKAERSDEAARYFMRALPLLESGADPHTLITALVELTTLEGTTRSEYAPALEHGERALRVARELANDGLEARAALALANARARSDTPAAGVELLELALRKGRSSGDVFVAAEAAASLSNAHYWAGDLRQALSFAEQRLEIAERGRDAFALRHAHTWLAMLATTAGDWNRAREMIAEATPAIARLGSPEPLGFLRLVEGLLALRTGETRLALERTRQAMAIFRPLGDATVSWYSAIHIWALIAAGQLEEAVAECAAQEARLASMPDSALPARSSRCGLGRAYVALGDVARAAECEARLTPFVDDFHWRPARVTLAAIAALRGDRERSLQLLCEAEPLAAANGLSFDLADVRRSIAGLQAGAPARDVFGRPDAPRLTPAVARVVPGGLSPREQEVLGLVAEGLTNREIAEHLVLSERTVVNHISHIFEKLGVENRAAATAFAFRTGLVRQQ